MYTFLESLNLSFVITDRIIVDILFGFAACDPELMPSFPQHRLKRKGQTEKDK